MSGGPQNATLSGDGFRFYRWEPAEGGEAHDLLSVTSIRKLLGTTHPLVEWGIGNLIDAAMGTVKRPAIGKRGKPLKGKNTYRIEEFPSEFVKRYMASDGKQDPATDLRKWLREESEQPRNIAANRGTMVHSAIEKNIRPDRIDRAWVEAAFMDLSQSDQGRVRNAVKDDDVNFIHNAVRQYWDMRENVPFVIIAREPQVFNLAMGYGGSADTLIWFLGHFVKDGDGATTFVPLPDLDMLGLPKGHELTLGKITAIGGTLAVGDWKTAAGVYTDNVVQVHAYGAGEFVGADGIVNHRLTEILLATTFGVVFHVRPDKWGVHVFPFTQEVFNGFSGAVAFARLLAKYQKPQALFVADYKGALPEEAL